MKLLTLKAIGFIFLFFISSATFSQIAASPSTSSTSKTSKATTYNYILSDLGTTAQATDLVTIFKARPGIIDAIVDLPNHKLTVKAPQEMLESDILEIIKYAGKIVLTDADLISKYY